MKNFGTLINCCAIFVFVFLFVFIFVSGATGPESRRRLHQGREDETAGQLLRDSRFPHKYSAKKCHKSFDIKQIYKIYKIGDHTGKMEPLKETTIQFEARRMVALEQQVC